MFPSPQELDFDPTLASDVTEEPTLQPFVRPHLLQ